MMLAFNLLKPTSNGENELGQEIFEYKQVAVFEGYMDMLDGSESTDKLAYIADSTHVILTKDRTVNAEIEDKIEVNGKTYEVTYVDDPVNIGHHLEIYVKGAH
ncbi:TPA: phage head closure protein [Streptococcus pneumoniae]|uniref:phage head closure protein n=2 Tax=Streptococcus pneumoniae TaxID=1313 RepID=UPI00077BE4AC|nr:phage head closure protein [Streptococcus pneumoniae]MBW7535598.1 phage head closure protein [Streptococcus pneumoniae]MDV8537945.1 phage head closure protein [Streptococcus pneumoniae]MDV8538580.1 phage head closure protein [Streptococcus pneumoniae]MDV8672954.1 phage head closure protein [Streptococcus pneumoniae]HET8319229.1 phage head closure protein [Streptococcus pneumoniae]